MGEQRVEQRLSSAVQRYPLEMSNGHAGRNYAVITGSNGIPILVDKAVGYVNPFLRKNGTVFWQNGYRSWGERLGITS